MDFMNKIKEIRKRLLLTQEKFGAGIDVEKSFIGQLETGKRTPGRKIIEKICSAYGIDPREFFETDRKPVIKTTDPLIAELENLPTHDRDLIVKIVQHAKEVSTEGKRDILKHTEEKELYEKVKKRKRKTA
jgi:transcriptional regulator with XRE-family HTH domain